MADYLFYLRRTATYEGVVDYTASNQFGRVVKGDTLWIVGLDGDQLLLRGRLRVSRVVGRRAAERHLHRHDLWDAKFYALTEEPEPFRAIEIGDLVNKVRFEGPRATLPHQLTGQHLQTMRKLTEPSIALLERAWTKGRRPRNPPWHRDELILALDLYIRLNRRIPDENDPNVIDLSQTLNALPIHTNRPDAARFRNSNGVVLKLANFRSLDKPGRGRSRIGKGDRLVWVEFSEKVTALQNAAEQVRLSIEPEQQSPPPSNQPSRRASDLTEAQRALSYLLGRRTQVVYRRHNQYQVRLRDFLASNGVEALTEQDFIDVQFRVDGNLYVGEVKVTGALTLEEAFRAALGQLLDYGHTRGTEPHTLVMFLDQRPDEQRLELATRLGIVVVVDETEAYHVVNPSGEGPLTRLFSDRPER